MIFSFTTLGQKTKTKTNKQKTKTPPLMNGFDEWLGF